MSLYYKGVVFTTHKTIAKYRNEWYKINYDNLSHIHGKVFIWNRENKYKQVLAVELSEIHSLYSNYCIASDFYEDLDWYNKKKIEYAIL